MVLGYVFASESVDVVLALIAQTGAIIVACVMAFAANRRSKDTHKQLIRNGGDSDSVGDSLFRLERGLKREFGCVYEILLKAGYDVPPEAFRRLTEAQFGHMENVHEVEDPD